MDVGSSVRAPALAASLRRGLSRARLARARVTLRSPHGAARRLAPAPAQAGGKL